MKAIIWKEFRENTKWAALPLAWMLMLTVGLLYDGYHASDWKPQASTGEIFGLMIFGSCAIATAVGVLQTILEIRRDQWAFLMHRGISATQIFLGKAIAGLSLYLIVMLVPLLIAAICYSRWSPRHFVFDWRYLVPVLIAVLASSGLYFASIIMIVRQSRVRFTNVFSLVLPALVLFLVAVFAVDINESIPLWMMFAIAVSIIPTALGAWGIFIRSGESKCLPRAASIGLGINLTVAFVVCLGCAVLAVNWFVEDYLQLKLRPSITSRFYSYAFTRDGHSLRTTYETLNDGIAPGQLPEMSQVDITDLDDPDSKIFDELRDWQFAVREDPSIRNREILNFQPMHTVDYQTDGLGAQLRRFRGVRRLVEPLPPFDDLSWCYSFSEGLLYGYDRNRQSARRNTVPPELKGVVGPQGFWAPDEYPGPGFGKPLLVGLTKFGRRQFALGARGVRGGATSIRQYLFFEDSIYEIDFTAKKVQQIYLPPEGKRIRTLTQLGTDRVAVVFADAIHVHRAEHVIKRREEDKQAYDFGNPLASLPGEFLFSIPIPEPVRQFDRFDFAALPGDETIVFACQSEALVPDMLLNRFVTMKRNGEVVQVRDFPNWPPNGLLRNTTPEACAVAVCVPPVVAFVAATADALIQTANGTGPGSLLRIMRYDPLALVPAVSVMLLLSGFSVALALFTSRRYGFAKSERCRWLLISILVGPAGLMALYCLRTWPLRLPCMMCGEPRPVDLEFCHRCKSAVEPVLLDGTEILQDAAAMAV